MVSRRLSSTTPAHLAYYYRLAFVLCLLLPSRARLATSSASNVDDGLLLGGLTGRNAADDVDIVTDRMGVDDANNDDDDLAIRRILSRLDSWVKEKRTNDDKLSDFRRDYDELLASSSRRRRHATRMTERTHRPFVTLAYAQTLDGMIAEKSREADDACGWGTAVGKSRNMALSSAASTVLTHRLRNVHDAILVGGNTFLLDRPRLNVRLPPSSKYGTVRDNDRQPMPVVLDTNLRHLQLLLFDEILSTEMSSLQRRSKDGALPDITFDGIRACRPIICCSYDAARTFLDTLEVVFRGEDENNANKRGRGRTRTHDRITVYEKVDEYYDEDEWGGHSPMRITFHVADHREEERDDDDDDDDDAILEDVTLTLLPCRVNEGTNSLDITHVLRQLRQQFDIETLMVEGGSSILSSFLNECPNDVDGADGTTTGGGNAVDCVCATIVPKMMGGKRGLPVLGGYGGTSTSSHIGIADPPRGLANVGDETHAIGGGMLSFKDGDFVKLGRDGIFLGRI